MPLIFVTASILLGLFIRFYALRLIPVGYYFDEMDYIFTGEAIARFGTDITGAWSPWSLKPPPPTNNISDLASVSHALVQSICGLGADTGHQPPAIFGLLSAAVTGTRTFKLTGDQSLVAVVAAPILISL